MASERMWQHRVSVGSGCDIYGVLITFPGSRKLKLLLEGKQS